MSNKYKYGVMFYLHDQPDKIIHVVLYHELPTAHDFFGLGVELATDKEFGISHVAHKLTFRYATDREVKSFVRQMNEDAG